MSRTICALALAAESTTDQTGERASWPTAVSFMVERDRPGISSPSPAAPPMPFSFSAAVPRRPSVRPAREKGAVRMQSEARPSRCPPSLGRAGSGRPRGPPLVGRGQAVRRSAVRPSRSGNHRPNEESQRGVRRLPPVDGKMRHRRISPPRRSVLSSARPSVPLSQRRPPFPLFFYSVFFRDEGEDRVADSESPLRQLSE